MSGVKTIADWWNEEVGKKLGVTVKLSIHDMRYDAAVIARTWPSIRAPRSRSCTSASARRTSPR